MTAERPAVAVALLVVLAGCALPFGDGGTADPATPGAGETPTITPTPNETSPYPPGVSEDEPVNVSRLLVAHTRALNRSGYVAVGTGNTTVLRSGFLVNVTRNVRIVVAAGSRPYHIDRRTVAGPVDRRLRGYSNGSVELRRFEEGSNVEYHRRDPRSTERLANVGTLDSFLRGGEFRVTELREPEGELATVVMRTNETANETALRGVLPRNADDRIRSYNATAVVDSEGRVRSLNASVGFVIGGENRTHTIDFDVTRLGVQNVTRPDWIEEMDGNDGANESDGRNDALGRPIERPT